MAEKTRYEPRDINVRAVLWFGAILVAAAILIHAGLAWLYVNMHQESERREPPPSPFGRRPPPPPPRLQPNPQQDLEEFRREQAELLQGYGWVDRQGGVARIPIDRAIELTVERGLPYRRERRADDR